MIGRKKLLLDLEEIEAAAEKVLADQERCKLYDINLRKTQEALNRLKDPGTPGEVWTCLARQFFSVPRSSLQSALQSDISTYKTEVNTLRDRIKEELNFLRELEGKKSTQRL
uniref:p53 and DNA damage-regulated protein 1 n=1 Tax=Schistocephalus solidus TaxID=70667 RepID=A0A0X3NP33_SCHSO